MTRGVLRAICWKWGFQATQSAELFSIDSDKAEYLTRRERDLLEHRPGLPRTEEPYRERCRRYAATSPAALACEKAVTREFYWEGAKRLSGQND